MNIVEHLNQSHNLPLKPLKTRTEVVDAVSAAIAAILPHVPEFEDSPDELPVREHFEHLIVSALHWDAEGVLDFDKLTTYCVQFRNWPSEV